MEFDKFQNACRFMKFGLVDGTTNIVEPTCRRSDRIPKGHSWGKCDEPHCPYYGIEFNTGTFFTDDGKKIGEVYSGRIIMGADSE